MRQIEICDTRNLTIKNFYIDVAFLTPVLKLKDILIYTNELMLFSDPLVYKKGTIGIFGLLASEDTPIHPGDRIEICAPVIVDPKLARRKKANKNLDLKMKNKKIIKASRLKIKELG